MKRLNLSLEQLELLDAISRRGSFAAAAEELHRVPSAVTYSIHQLEERLGAAIFDRSGHRAELTPAGRLLLKEGRRLLNAAVDLETRVRQVAGGWEAEFRLVSSDIFPMEAYWPLIARFREECGQTRLFLRQETFGGAWDALQDGRADLAIGAPEEGPAGGGYKTRKLADIDWCFAVSPEHPLAACRHVLTREDIEAHCVVAAEDSSRRLPPRHAGIVSGHDVLNVPDMKTKRSAQRAGIGVGFLPRLLIASDLASGRLIEKAVEEPRDRTPLYLAWRRNTAADGDSVISEAGNALRWWLAALKTWQPFEPSDF